MHELLAVCMMVVDHDSLDTSSSPSPSPISPLPFSPLYRGPTPAGIMEALSATLDRTYVEHDAFGLFQELMKPSKSFYEWRSEEGPVS
jgi:TBC1 domain family protein 5